MTEIKKTGNNKDGWYLEQQSSPKLPMGVQNGIATLETGCTY